jgi:PleD family two-component response regulator
VTVSNQINSEELLQQANAAFYQAKPSGRNCAMLATESETFEEVQGQGFL